MRGYSEVCWCNVGSEGKERIRAFLYEADVTWKDERYTIVLPRNKKPQQGCSFVKFSMFALLMIASILRALNMAPGCLVPSHSTTYIHAHLPISNIPHGS